MILREAVKLNIAVAALKSPFNIITAYAEDAAAYAAKDRGLRHALSALNAAIFAASALTRYGARGW